MTTTTTSIHISLPKRMKKEVIKEVSAGQFSNTTDYVRHLIRLDLLKKRAKQEFSSFIRQGMISPSCEQLPQEMVAELKNELV